MFGCGIAGCHTPVWSAFACVARSIGQFYEFQFSGFCNRTSSSTTADTTKAPAHRPRQRRVTMCVCAGAGVRLCVAVLSESLCAVAVTLTVLAAGDAAGCTLHAVCLPHSALLPKGIAPAAVARRACVPPSSGRLADLDPEALLSKLQF